MSFAQLLATLQAEGAGACKHLVGSASFLDEEDYDRLGSRFDEAVAAFTASFGEPIQGNPQLAGRDVERAACWWRGELILYAMLTLEDNSRQRTLTLGLARRGTIGGVS